MAPGKELIKSRWVLEAAGAALLLVGPWFYPMILPGNIGLYHHHLNFRNMIEGILLVLAAVFFLSLAAISALSRLPERLRSIAGAVLTGMFLWLFVETVASLYVQHMQNEPADLLAPVATKLTVWNVVPSLLYGQSKSLAFTLPAIFLLLALLRIQAGAGISRWVRAAIAAFAFCGFWIIPQLMYLAYALRPAPSFNHLATAAATNAKPHGRIVWLLFDELSYDLVFDHQPEGLSFPEFEHFTTNSVSFVNLEPAGYYTESVLPSILSGKETVEISSTVDGKLKYYDNEKKRWERFDPSATLFGVAKEEGWNPAVAGWHNPYCRTYAKILSACSWEASPYYKFPLEKINDVENSSALENSAYLALHFFPLPLNTTGINYSDAVETRIRSYTKVMSKARSLIEDGRTSFVFVHLPVPHPPGFFNRNTHQLSVGGNYIDNLVLADHTLKELLDEVDKTRWASETTVIVSSDHSWRVPNWKTGTDWTAEEEQVSRGKFEPRPVLMVHLPGETVSYQISQKTPELLEHEIVAAMLKEQVSSPQQLIDMFHLQEMGSSKIDSGETLKRPH